ncbi:MAG: hypothetical protein R3252_12310 [Robiginitalea sp.]|nr:hypothetical protein [Robiginitalea sp.]
MRKLLFVLLTMVGVSGIAQELNESAQTLKDASEKDMADFYDCIEYRAILKYGEQDTEQQVEYINRQAEALFEYFELRDSLIDDPVSAAMMLKVAWKWGAKEGGLCEVEWKEAVLEVRSNLKAAKQ